MNVVLLANSDWLDEELPVFRAMVVGLLDEQVRVTQVLPEQTSDVSSPFGRHLTWQETRWGTLRRLRLARLSAALADDDVDVIHALHSDLWSGAIRLAARLDVPAVLTVNAAADIPRVHRVLRTAGGVRVAFIASTAPLGKAVSEQSDGRAIVQVVPPGAHVARLGDAAPTEDRPACGVITGNGLCDPPTEALLQALKPILQAFPQTQFFVDSQGVEPYRLWQSASRLGLLSSLSIVPHRPGIRELLLRADMIIQPQALGQSRSLHLQAMMHGVPVIAQADPWLDYLVPNVTARLTGKPVPEEWRAILHQVISDRESTRQLTRTAREWVERRHLAARQVALTISLYRRITGPMAQAVA